MVLWAAILWASVLKKTSHWTVPATQTSHMKTILSATMGKFCICYIFCILNLVHAISGELLILTSFVAPHEYVELRGMLRNACRHLPLVSFQYGWWDTLALSTMSPFKAIHLSINIQVTIKTKLYREIVAPHTSHSAYEDLFLGNEESDCLPPCSLLFANTKLRTQQVVLFHIFEISSLS